VAAVPPYIPWDGFMLTAEFAKFVTESRTA